MPANEQLVSFIRREQDRGKKKEEITRMLFEAQWHTEAINDAFKEVGGNKAAQSKARWLLIIVAPVILLSVLLTAYLYSRPQKVKQNISVKSAGFQTLEQNDEKRVADLKKIQATLEEYFKKNRKYPVSLSELGDVPQNPSGNSYAYTPIGEPPLAYTLVAQMETVGRNDVGKDGFYTLKNQEGQR